MQRRSLRLHEANQLWQMSRDTRPFDAGALLILLPTPTVLFICSRCNRTSFGDTNRATRESATCPTTLRFSVTAMFYGGKSRKRVERGERVL